jgi:hypothetical protein
MLLLVLRETILAEAFYGLPQFLQANSRTLLLKLGHACFLPHKFIIY